MKFREVTIFTGRKFSVPQGIQRIDHRATHGWQLRYGGTKLFSDGGSDGSGAAASRAAATKELVRRIGKRRLAVLDHTALTSAARYRRDGWRLRPARNVALLSLYFLGVPPRWLARLYGR